MPPFALVGLGASRSAWTLATLVALLLGAGTAGASVQPPGVVDLSVEPGVAGASGYTLAGRLVVSVPSVAPNPQVARIVVRLEARDGTATITPATVTHERPALDTALATDLEVAVPFGEVEVVAIAEAFADDGRKLWGRADSVFILAQPSEARIGSSSIAALVREELTEHHKRGALTEAEFDAATRALLTNRARVPGTASFAAAPAAPHPRGGLVATTTAEGTCRYVVRDGTIDDGPFRPIANAAVRFLDRTPDGDVTIGETTTDAAGHYSATAPGTRNGNAVNLVVFVFAVRRVNGTTVAAVGPADQRSDVYSVSSDPVTVTSPTTSIEVTASGGADFHRAFSVFDVLNVGFDFVRAQNAGGVGNDPLVSPLSFVEFPGDDANSAFFSSGGDTHLHIGRNFAFDWDILFHEFGHYVQYLNDTLDSPGGTHILTGNNTGNNCDGFDGDVCVFPHPPYTKDEGTRLAWTEGWATYYGIYLQVAVDAASFGVPTAGDTRYDDTAGGFGSDLESNTDYERARGEDSEISIQRILWDLADTPNDESDTLALGTDFIIRASLGPAKPVTLSEFWNVILPDLPATSAGDLIANQIRAGAILGDHGAAPLPTDPVDALPIDRTTPPPTFTWLTQGAGGSPNPFILYGPSYRLNRFTVKFYTNAFSSLVFTSPEIVTDGATDATASYTPSAADWATIVAAGTVQWTVEGRSNNLAPETGPYFSQARTLSGQESGFIPPDKAAMSCTGKAAANVSKLLAALAKCHTRAAAAAFKAKVFDLGACESKATLTYDAKLAGLKNCPACVRTNGATIRDAVHAFLDERNGDLFCAGSTVLGGGLSGFVPPDKDALACATKLTGAGTKLESGIGKCHVKAANTVFKGKPFDLGGCEAAAAAKYAKTASSAKKCPACSLTGAAGLRSAIETMLDGRNGLVYCAGTDPFPG